MTRYVFSDEAGCFEFSRKPNVSKYFIVCAVDMDDCDLGKELLDLRREMAWEGLPLGDFFHCTKDHPKVRARVFELICKHDFRVYAQILEKSKAQPQIRPNKERFYKHAWLYLLRHCLPKMVNTNDRLMITAASIGTKKGQTAFSEAVKDVLDQTARHVVWRAAFWSSASDPCLQVTDYCTWAIQRKWERGDSQAYDLIKDKIVYEYDLWAHGQTYYY